MVVDIAAAQDGTQVAVSGGVVGLVVGLVLCFFGVRSLRLTGFLVGFTLAAALADVVGANPLVALIVGVAGGVGGFLLVSLVFRASLWLLGGLTGGTIAVTLYRHLFPGEGTALAVVVFMVAAGLICGFLTDHYRRPVLAVVTAIGGAGAALGAVGAIWPASTDFLRVPATTAQSAIGGAAWALLAAAGWLVQHRWLTRKALR